MKSWTGLLCKWAGLWIVAVVVGLAAGCDDSDFDHDPPAGQGSLIVDNLTGYRMHVYINGQSVGDVSAGDDEYFDRWPGLCRVVIDGEDADQSWGDEVDILEGRLTVLEVRPEYGSYNAFDVNVYFD